MKKSKKKISSVKKKKATPKKEATISHKAYAANVLKCDPEKVEFLLRTCDENMLAYNKFKWPEKGLVVAPDWNAEPKCGYGLHGLLHGEGDSERLSKSNLAKWIVIAAVKEELVYINQKYKTPRACVVHVGDKKSATDLIISLCPGSACAFGHSTSGDYGHSTSGDYGHSTSGNSGHSTSGDMGIIQLEYWDKTASRKRVNTYYVGENGVLPWHTYKLDEQHNLVDEGHGPSMAIHNGMRAIC